MPFYSDAPFSPKAYLASPGSVTFLLGSRAATGGTMQVTSVAIASNVATVGVTSWSGNLPVIGTVVSIRGTSQGSGEFNVVAKTLTGVTLDANGTGTLTFALTGSNLATTADGGTLVFEPAISGEVVAAGATIPASPAFNPGRSVNTWFYEITPDSSVALPTAATFTPQHAMVNQDSAFIAITGAPTATIAAGAITVAGGQFSTDAPFVRFAITGVTNSTGKTAVAVTF